MLSYGGETWILEAAEVKPTKASDTPMLRKGYNYLRIAEISTCNSKKNSVVINQGFLGTED